MILNERFELSRSALSSIEELISCIETASDRRMLRWAVVGTTKSKIVVEATTAAAELLMNDPPKKVGPWSNGRMVVANIVPTGIACSIGGFAGDAAPATALLAAAADYLICHPNCVNASDFIFMTKNTLYAEGSIIDSYCAGESDLYVPYANRIGLVIDKCDESVLSVVINIANAVRAVHGVSLLDPIVLPCALGAAFHENPSGAVVGQLKDPELLLAACKSLLARGASAIAVTSAITNLPVEEYRRHLMGDGPNPVGGAEAIISHLITQAFGVPAAHAPIQNCGRNGLNELTVDPRSAGEYISMSGLACVLIGLRTAPHIIELRGGNTSNILGASELRAVVCPASALGGKGLLKAYGRGVPIIAVKESTTTLNVNADSLGLEGILQAETYLDAAGMLLAIKTGIGIESIRRPLPSLVPTKLSIVR